MGWEHCSNTWFARGILEGSNTSGCDRSAVAACPDVARLKDKRTLPRLGQLWIWVMLECSFHSTCSKLAPCFTQCSRFTPRCCAHRCRRRLGLEVNLWVPAFVDWKLASPRIKKKKSFSAASERHYQLDVCLEGQPFTAQSKFNIWVLSWWGQAFVNALLLETAALWTEVSLASNWCQSETPLCFTPSLLWEIFIFSSAWVNLSGFTWSLSSVMLVPAGRGAEPTSCAVTPLRGTLPACRGSHGALQLSRVN